MPEERKKLIQQLTSVFLDNPAVITACTAAAYEACPHHVGTTDLSDADDFWSAYTAAAVKLLTEIQAEISPRTN